MSTRGYIARANPDGTFTAIYQHSDSYPSGLGETLESFWTEPAKIDALMALGHLSHIGEVIGEKHAFDWETAFFRWDDIGAGFAAMRRDPRDKMCKAYGRDRGMIDREAETYSNFTELKRRLVGSDIEYLYVWGEGGWGCYSVLETDLSPMLTVQAMIAHEKEENDREAAASDS